MLTRNSRRALSEKIEDEGSPAKRRRVDQGSKRTNVKKEISESKENTKRKVKASQSSENCDPRPSTSRARILPRHSRQALSEKVNNKQSQEKKLKVERVSKKVLLKNEISEPLENEMNIKTSPPKRRKMDRASKKIPVKNEILGPLGNELNIKTSPPKRHKVDRASKKKAVKNEISEPFDDTENIKTSPSSMELSEPHSNENNQEYSHNVENCIQGPPTSKDKITKINTDAKEEILPFSTEKEKDNLIGNEALLKQEAKADNNDSIVELEVPQKVVEEVLLYSDDEDENIEARKRVTTQVDNSVGTNLIVPVSAETNEDNLVGKEASLNQEEAVADNDESIIELEIPQKVFEEVSLFSDDEDEQNETRESVTTQVDNSVGTNLIVPVSAETNENNLTGNEASLNQEEAVAENDESIVELEVPQKVFEEVLLSPDDENEKIETRMRRPTLVNSSVNLPSGSSGNNAQASTSASHSNSIEVIKIEDPSPQSAMTPKQKKIVLDPSILTPPTGSLQENAAKYWKCLQFLEQSDLNPEANEFVPSPKVTKKVTEEPKPTDCIICLEPRETTFVNLPCRHAVTCGPCSDQLELRGEDCPVCRTPIETRFQIYN